MLTATTPLPITLDQLAKYAYQEMIRQAHELQQRIIANRATVDEFGDDALPNYRAIRESIHAWDVRTSWQITRHRHMIQDRERLADLIGQIEWLETMFAENRQRSAEAFGKAMAEHYHQTNGEG